MLNKNWPVQVSNEPKAKPVQTSVKLTAEQSAALTRHCNRIGLNKQEFFISLLDAAIEQFPK